MSVGTATGPGSVSSIRAKPIRCQHRDWAVMRLPLAARTSAGLSFECDVERVFALLDQADDLPVGRPAQAE